MIFRHPCSCSQPTEILQITSFLAVLSNSLISFEKLPVMGELLNLVSREFKQMGYLVDNVLCHTRASSVFPLFLLQTRKKQGKHNLSSNSDFRSCTQVRLRFYSKPDFTGQQWRGQHNSPHPALRKGPWRHSPPFSSLLSHYHQPQPWQLTPWISYSGSHRPSSTEFLYSSSQYFHISPDIWQQWLLQPRQDTHEVMLFSHLQLISIASKNVSVVPSHLHTALILHERKHVDSGWFMSLPIYTPENLSARCWAGSAPTTS